MNLSQNAIDFLDRFVSMPNLNEENWFDFVNQYVRDNGTTPIDETELIELIKERSENQGRTINLDDSDIYKWIAIFTGRMTTILSFLRQTGRK